MKHICPYCGHEWDDGEQARAARARWDQTRKNDRKAAAKAAADARWEKWREQRGAQNAGGVPRPENAPAPKRSTTEKL